LASLKSKPRRGGTKQPSDEDSDELTPETMSGDSSVSEDPDAEPDEEADVELDDEYAYEPEESGDEDPASEGVLDVEAETLEEEVLSSSDRAAISSRRSTAIVPVPSDIDRGQPRDPLAAYMREVQRHPLLNREDEHRLATLYFETGDVDAAKKLVTSNLRLVVKIAYEYKRAHRNMMDLVQEGNIGLMQAVKRFDPTRGVKLSTYSAWWIRAYMLRFILNNWRLVKLGTTQAQRKLFFNLNKERARLTALGIEPTHEEIAKRLDVSKKEVREMDLRLASSDSSLDVPVGDSEGRQTSRLDLLPFGGEGPDSLVEKSQLLAMLREHLDTFRETLSGKDLEIFDRRMIAEEPETLQQLGDDFGVSRERVRQLEARIIGKLRVFLYECLGDAVQETPLDVN
jgi:RNA polymerase sigma-32 factor